MPNNESKHYSGLSDTSNILVQRAIMPSSLESIDRALFEWVDDELDLFCNTNKGWKKTPVVWLSAERAYQIKNDKDVRSVSGSLILPMVTIERASVVKDPAKKGIYFGHVPPYNDYRGGSITVARKINQEKTSNFANANAAKRRGQINFPKPNKKIVYQTMTTPMPVYVDISYKITLRTEYQEQMNQLVTPFITKTGGINYFVLKKEGHRYEAFIQQDFTQNNNISAMETDERTYHTQIEIKVLGYLIGQDKNQEQPRVVIRENAVEVKIPRERVIYGEIPELPADEVGFYRE